MADTVDFTLVLERLNELMAGQREMRKELAAVKVIAANSSTRSQFLALAETLSQFDNLLSILDARVAVIEARTEH